MTPFQPTNQDPRNCATEAEQRRPTRETSRLINSLRPSIYWSHIIQ